MGQKKQIDLTLFCDLYGCQEQLLNPFSDDKHTYACTGFICVRVPRVEGYAAKGEIDPLILPWTPIHAGKWQEIPEYIQPARMESCPLCQGTTFSKLCLNCDGVGESCGGECPDCNGWGYVSAAEGRQCPQCEGTGRPYLNDIPTVRISGIKVNVMLLDKISALPDVKVYLPASDKGMVNFSFTGGDGILMVMRD